MWKDEIVEEVRKTRDEYAAKFNYNLDEIFADLQKKQAESGREYVSFISRKPPASETNPENEKKAA